MTYAVVAAAAAVVVFAAVKQTLSISITEKIELTFKVNALAHFWTLKAFLPGMVEARKGHLVSIASLAGLFGNAKLVDYCASKFAAVGIAESLLFELER